MWDSPDPRSVRAAVDLLVLVGQDVTLRRVAATRGGEYAGPCPFCGGTDRLRVQPKVEGGGQWWCRQCSPDERWGDAFDYVRRRDGCSFPEALALLTGKARGLPSPPLPPRNRPTSDPPRLDPRQANQAVAECAAALHERPEALTYLHQQRGLNAATITAARLGWSEGGEVAGLSIPRGHVIPWVDEHGIPTAINVRRSSDSLSKYLMVTGSRRGIYLGGVGGAHQTVFLVEGEYDALLLHQNAADLASVLTLGSARTTIPAAALGPLLGFDRILVAMDPDQAGTKAAKALGTRSRRIMPVSGPLGSGDITDAWRSGVDLREWAARVLLEAATAQHGVGTRLRAR